MQVFAYLRVSSKGQTMGHGYDRQHQAIETYCKSHRHKIARVYRESISGTTDTDGRPEFKAMVTGILKNGVNTIVVESLDRLAREYRVQEQLMVYLASKGINLIAANTGENVTKAISDDPMKKAMIQMQGIFAELDKSLTVRKLRKAREQVRKDRGKCEGRKSYAETPEGLEVLQVIRRLRRKGKGKKLPSYVQVAEHLNGLGHRSKNGKPFSGNVVCNILYRAKR